MCVQDNWKSFCTWLKNIQRSRCIKCGCLFVLELLAATTTSLQRHFTFCLFHLWPQRAPPRAIGMSSFTAIGWSMDESGHHTCNHLLLPHHTPQPKRPEASDASSIVNWSLCFQTLMPFHSSADVFHQSKSDQNSRLRRNWWCAGHCFPRLVRCDSRSINHRKKDVHGLITSHVWF